jgi:hypothetical protein
VEAAEVTKVQCGDAKCSWCGQDFPARRGGSPRRFCSTEHRSLFWSALRRWAERAVAAGILTIADIRNGDPAACTLPQYTEQPSSLRGIGRGDPATPDTQLRFLVEVEQHTVAGLLKLGFIRPDERDELGAIIAGMKRLGRTPNTSRIA